MEESGICVSQSHLYLYLEAGWTIMVENYLTYIKIKVHVSLRDVFFAFAALKEFLLLADNQSAQLKNLHQPYTFFFFQR